jgi:hypothetical protein
MKLEQRDNKYIVVDDNGKILIITQSKAIAKNYLTKHSE